MKALCWHGKGDVRVDNVPDPQIKDPRDAIIKITSTAICGSDLHLYDGFMPTMESGDVLGHEFMGVVVEVGRGNSKLKNGDRVVVPFTIDFMNESVYDRLQEMTHGRGPDRCIDAIGCEAHVPGVYLGFVDKMPMGAFVNKALAMKSGQTHVHRYLQPLTQRIESGQIDPSFVITHKAPLADAPDLYKTFRDRQDGCIKVVLNPWN